MSVFAIPTRTALLMVAFAGSTASAGVVTATVDGIAGANWQWEVPVLQPGQVWSQTFAATSVDQTASVTGSIEAGVSANGRQAWLNVTDFEMGATRAMELDFIFNANIAFGVLFSGWANPYQEFDADQAVNSFNGRIDWSKGALWNNKGLPALGGFFAPDNLQSSLFASSGIFDYFLSPVVLDSSTRIVLRTGGLDDAVLLPDSAYDFIDIPGPGVLALLGGMIAVRRRR